MALQYVIILFVVLIPVCSILYCLPKQLVFHYLDRYPNIISRLPPPHINNKTVTITIDDVPYGASFPEILAVLDKYNVKATFLTISSYIDTTSEQLIINAMRNGHEFANHGNTNRRHSRLSASQLINEIDTCNAKLRKLYRRAQVEPTGTRFYRLGCGTFNQHMIDYTKEKDMYIVLGSVYPHDAHMPSATINIWYMQYKIDVDDIIIMHDRWWTVGMLDNLLAWLYENNYQVRKLGDVIQ